MATELAKAYVQIIPSAKGIKGELASAMSGEASSAGESAGGKFSGAFGKVLKGSGMLLAGSLTTATAGIASLSKASIDAYADFEQLEGGIQTLFGDDWQKVASNASKAFETAGMSANEYMETVTSFSASLIQSVGGDTKKASEQADKALTMMSDNANKMGTDMESIQNAFRGFAKQNYTMLDNLSLGYGGTKQEMQRLLDDATKLSGVKYDMESYSDIIDAIKVIQDEMGITGTTAKEASTTISGSLGMLSASWTDLLAGMSNDNANMKVLMDNVLNSFSSVVQNIAPRITEVLSSISGALEYLVPQIVSLLAELASTLLPILIESAQGLLTSLLETLPTLLESFSSVIPMLIEAIITMLPLLLDAGIQILMQLAQGIAEAMPQLIPAIVQCVVTMVETLLNNVDLLIETAKALVDGITEGIIMSLPTLVEKAPELVMGLADAIIQLLPVVLDCGVQLILAIVEGIALTAFSIGYEIGLVISDMIDAFAMAWDDFKQAGGNIVDGLLEGIKGAWDKVVNWITEKCNALVQKVENVFKIQSPSRVFAGIGEYLALGLGVGFTDEIDNVNNEIASSINKDFELDATANIASAMSMQQSPINASPYDAMQQAFNEGIIRVEVVASADSDSLFDKILVKNAEYKKMHGGSTAFA